MNTEFFKWTSVAGTHPGKKRKVNEDRYFNAYQQGLWVVADGMGGHNAGDIASQATVDAFEDFVVPDKMSDFVTTVEEKIIAVNDQLYADFSREGRTGGTTVVAMLALDQHCAFLWAGDSRVYCYRDGMLWQMTQDHSYVEELVEQKLLTRAEAENHPDANVIRRAVGAEEHLCLDIDLHPLQADDIYVLCSDGLYKEINETEIAAILSPEKTSEAMTRELLSAALNKSGKDNVTVVVVKIYLQAETL